MDIFTDVDLLFEVLDAASRRVPVYILLDEMNSQLFLDTAAKCRVNLNYVKVSKDLPYLIHVLRGMSPGTQRASMAGNTRERGERAIAW